ncbi:hypoxanthine phosphoribosyltransferase [Humidesulfovibrio mexicanus]|uniref:Hypoxanthine phosphoribosyltransferase n=1 Tax=Humidesulfovibrio mexicanus TaxID=147047 RepID=A0A239CVT4_9BACT|nr:hypoxanthine phosphoribosyltransferase [Humidesulfovibrio mexicanus]SNS23463.1 hypoxanthine phosphoribosyltransferase [Humidesulfovibrio mexicanus]
MSHSMKTVIDSQSIQRRVAELGAEITAFYAGKPLVAVCVLKGAFLFFADLVRHIKNDALELDFVRMASYGSGTNRSRQTIFSKDMEVDVSGKHVLLVEDIVDTGHSARFLFDVLEKRGAESVRICAAVDKHERREIALTVDFAGFPLQKGFIVGYGMDYAEKYRELDAVYELVL